MQDSPYDPDARYGKKRATSWVGYKLHVTESCDADALHLVGPVATTPACVADETMLTPIHEGLARRGFLASRQSVDAGYVDAKALATNQARFGVDILGPTRGNWRWQARETTGFEGRQFAIDWEAQRAICPQRHVSRTWRKSYDHRQSQPARC